MLTEVPQSTTNSLLTAEQKAKVYGVLAVGCDRETAANLVGCTPSEITRAMHVDAEFAAKVRRTEAAVELGHMRIILNEALENKSWRAAVWWLERRSPERFGSRGAGTVTVSHMRAYLTLLGEALSSAIQNADDRERVAAKFTEFRTLAEDLADDLLRSVPRTGEPTSPTVALLTVDDLTSTETEPTTAATSEDFSENES